VRDHHGHRPADPASGSVPPHAYLLPPDLPPSDLLEGYQPWERAWQHALYGPSGFYRRPEGPAGHFRTAAHAAPGPLADAVATLAHRCGRTGVVDVGAGRGELLTALAGSPARRGLALHGVDVVPRPPALPRGIGWSAGLPELDDATLDGALVVAWELLDVVACRVVEVDDADAVRLVEVDPATGDERLGAPASPDDLAWLHHWWQLEPGRRAEVGRPRDAFWAELVARCASSTTAPRGAVLLAVDYAHTAGARPPAGSLAGYRAGRQVVPVPDGGCDLTADVALDAVAAAGRAAGASATRMVSQREALRALGVHGRVRASGPAGFEPADVGPAGFVRASQQAELIDPRGFGGFGWLLQATGPAVLPDLCEPSGSAG